MTKALIASFFSETAFHRSTEQFSASQSKDLLTGSCLLTGGAVTRLDREYDASDSEIVMIHIGKYFLYCMNCLAKGRKGFSCAISVQ